MHLCERMVQEHIQRSFAISSIVGVSVPPVQGTFDLTPKEQLRYQRLIGTPRCSAWLAGRAALKRVLGILGESTDTSDLAFPHSRLSLTHSGRHAVALGVPRDLGIVGIGIDFEANKHMRPEGDRFFLSSDESDWIRSCRSQDQSAERLRLWTIKEALFKAYHDNSRTLLTDYRIIDPSEHSGIGRVKDSMETMFSYSSLYCVEGIVSVAVSQHREVLT